MPLDLQGRAWMAPPPRLFRGPKIGEIPPPVSPYACIRPVGPSQPRHPDAQSMVALPSIQRRARSPCLEPPGGGLVGPRPPGFNARVPAGALQAHRAGTPPRASLRHRRYHSSQRRHRVGWGSPGVKLNVPLGLILALGGGERAGPASRRFDLSQAGPHVYHAEDRRRRPHVSCLHSHLSSFRASVHGAPRAARRTYPPRSPVKGPGWVMESCGLHAPPQRRPGPPPRPQCPPALFSVVARSRPPPRATSHR